MRECGEEVLVDISEILFNELAFYKLMQDLDDPDIKDRIALNKWRPALSSNSASNPTAATQSDVTQSDVTEDDAGKISSRSDRRR